jgi:hypothetical protein
MTIHFSSPTHLSRFVIKPAIQFVQEGLGCSLTVFTAKQRMSGAFLTVGHAFSEGVEGGGCVGKGDRGRGVGKREGGGGEEKGGVGNTSREAGEARREIKGDVQLF